MTQLTLPQFDNEDSSLVQHFHIGPVNWALQAGLQHLVERQRVVSQALDPTLFEGGQVDKEQVGTIFAALITETTELLQELEWKPWKKSAKTPDPNRVADEFADILAFLGVAMLVIEEQTGLGPEALAAAYQAKVRVNLERADNGY